MPRIALLLLLLIVSGCGTNPVPTTEQKPAAQDDPPKKTEVPKDEQIIWKQAGKEASTINGLDFELFRVGIRPQPDKKYVEILWIASTKIKKKYKFQDWQDQSLKLVAGTKEYPRLTVPFDVSVKPNLLEDGVGAEMYRAHQEPKDGVISATLVNPPWPYATFEGSNRDAIWRALYFDLPSQDASEWQLTLSAKAFGLQGTFAFKIDPKMVISLPPIAAK